MILFFLFNLIKFLFNFYLNILFFTLRNFEFETFLQILYVVPHFYIYSWEKLNDKNYNLHIGVPRDIEERISVK